MSRTGNLLEKIHIEFYVDGILKFNVNELQGTIWNGLGHHFFDEWKEDSWMYGVQRHRGLKVKVN